MIKHTQTIRWQQPTNRLIVFDHFVRLVLKELKISCFFFIVRTATPRLVATDNFCNDEISIF